MFAPAVGWMENGVSGCLLGLIEVAMIWRALSYFSNQP